MESSHFWPPCSSRPYQVDALDIAAAKGPYFITKNGQKIIDGISSWWCKSLGHSHPRLQAAAIAQINKYEHVMMANNRCEVIEKLSDEFSGLFPFVEKVFYAGDGSCAVEVAMKMSLHSRFLEGSLKRKKFLALENGYHGETLGALSVSDCGLYRKPYEDVLINPILIPTDTVGKTQKALESINPEDITAFIFEPLIQGAGGMNVYRLEVLQTITSWCRAHNIHLIADEIMTGMGRTGSFLLSQALEPDFSCLSKGLTGGWIPFSAVLVHQKACGFFEQNTSKEKAFLHSHTYSGNALGAALALETITVMKEENLCQRSVAIGLQMRETLEKISLKTGKLKNVRGIGCIAAADLQETSPLVVTKECLKRGVFIRPLGETLYLMPPLNTPDSTLKEMQNILENVLKGL